MNELAWAKKRNFWQPLVVASAGFLAGDVLYALMNGPSPATYPSGATAITVLVGSLARLVYCSRRAGRAVR